jgi:hypothetical protein
VTGVPRPRKVDPQGIRSAETMDGPRQFRSTDNETVEAFHFDGSNHQQLLDWLYRSTQPVRGGAKSVELGEPGELHLETVSAGDIDLIEDDWVVRHEDGTFTAHRPEMFASKFLEV